MKKEGEISHIFYLYLHSKIWAMAKGKLISERDLKKYLFQWKIPKVIKPLIVKELILLRLIERENRYTLKINRPKFNEEELSEYYRELGLY